MNNYRNCRRYRRFNNYILTENEELAFQKLEILNPVLVDVLYEEDSETDEINKKPDLQDVSSDDDPSPDQDDDDKGKDDQKEQKNPEDMSDEELAQMQAQQQAQQDPNQVLMMELDATQEKIVQFNIYTKLGELRKNLNFAIENISFNKITNTDIIEKLRYYKDLLDVLNELIFVLTPSTLYMIFGTTQMEITVLLKEYLENKKLNEKIEDKKIMNKENETEFGIGGYRNDY